VHWLEQRGRRLSVEDLSADVGLNARHVAVCVRNLQQFLLRGSGWRMVEDAKTGVALEPEDRGVPPTCPSKGAGGDPPMVESAPPVEPVV
jgi:hypothetical protein